MLRDIMRETRDFPYITQEEQTGERRDLPLQQAFIQGLQQAQKEMTLELRQTLLKIVKIRFPAALRLAKKQTMAVEDSDVLRDLIVKTSTARSIGEAIECLLEVDEEGEEE
jgi:small-conductance mechanosensitive channel